MSGAFGVTEGTFNIQDWKAHAEVRKPLGGPYSFTSIKKMEPMVDERIKSWLGRLRTNFAETGHRFSLALWSTFLVFDVVSAVAFG